VLSIVVRTALYVLSGADVARYWRSPVATASRRSTVIPSAVLLVFGVVMGTALIWDLGGFASRMRQRLEERSFDGALYRRMPS
jgi:hypothetical protein